MTEIRRSANRSYGLVVPRPVKEWLRREICSIFGSLDISCSGDLCQLVRELLVEASQRPEFNAYAESCQTASLKSPENMRVWVGMLLRGQKPKPSRRVALVTLRPRVQLRVEPAQGDAVMFTYRVAFQGSVSAQGLSKGGRPRKGVKLVPLKIDRTFATAADAFDYEERVREAIAAPGLATPAERAAAAYAVPLKRQNSR